MFRVIVLDLRVRTPIFAHTHRDDDMPTYKKTSLGRCARTRKRPFTLGYSKDFHRKTVPMAAFMYKTEKGRQPNMD